MLGGSIPNAYASNAAVSAALRRLGWTLPGTILPIDPNIEPVVVVEGAFDNVAVATSHDFSPGASLTVAIVCPAGEIWEVWEMRSASFAGSSEFWYAPAGNLPNMAVDQVISSAVAIQLETADATGVHLVAPESGALRMKPGDAIAMTNTGNAGDNAVTIRFAYRRYQFA